MKKVLLTLAVVGVASSIFAQGTVQFILNGSGFAARIYGPEAGDNSVSKTGNTTSGLPSGTQVYTGPLLAGAGFRAQLFAADGLVTDSSLLVASPVIATFRTGSAAGLVPAGLVATFANVASASALATVQVRAWDNTSGLYPTWADADVAWRAGLIAAGGSILAQTGMGGGAVTPPIPSGLRSFNIYYNIVPEPSTFALAGLGAAAMLIFRRRK